MSANDRDTRFEELLRNVLQDEADTIHPAGDGLTRIQQRVGSRRFRSAWFSPLAATGAAVVVAGAGFAAYEVVHKPGPVQSVAGTGTPSPTQSALSTPTATVKRIQTLHFPTRAFYPFTNARQEKAWETQYAAQGSEPWHADPALTAQLFVQSFVGQPSANLVLSHTTHGSSSDVTIGTNLNDSSSSAPHPVTVVHLVKWGKAWLVVGADDADGKLMANVPLAGTTLTTPATVSGPGFGVDEGVAVDVRSLNSGGPLGPTQHATFGAGTPTWSLTVPFATPPDPVGAVVLVEASAAGTGQPGRIAVVPVHFAASTGTEYPTAFVGVKRGAVTVFSSRTAAALRYLTAATPSDPPTDARLVGDSVYFVRGTKACAATLFKVPFQGSRTQPAVVAQPDTGYNIVGFSVSLDGRKVAYYERECVSAPSTVQAHLVAVDTTNNNRHVIDFTAEPPAVVGNPSWEPDGQHLDAIVRTGNSSYLARYDAFNDTSATAPAVCSGFQTSSGLPAALEVDGNGTIWFSIQTGSSIQVLSCRGTTPVVAFTLSGDNAPSDVDAEPNGRAVLVTDANGRVWRWSGSGQPTQLHPSVGLTQASW